jgi:hypothetical protein
MDVHGELEGLASWPARTERSRGHSRSPTTATATSQAKRQRHTTNIPTSGAAIARGLSLVADERGDFDRAI